MYFYHLLEYEKHVNLIREASGTPSYRVSTERDFSWELLPLNLFLIS